MTSRRHDGARDAGETPTPSPAQKRKLRRAEITCVAGVLLFATLAVLVARGATADFDRSVLEALRNVDDPATPLLGAWLVEVARDVTALGSTTVLVLVTTLVAAYLGLGRSGRAFAVVVAAAVGGVLVDVALKAAFARERPESVPHLCPADSLSFPSGHSMMAAAVYPTLGVLLGRFARRRVLEAYAIGASALLVMLVGLSRLVLGVHHPSDVLAGWAAGAAWASLSWLAVDRLARRGNLGGDAGT